MIKKVFFNGTVNRHTGLCMCGGGYCIQSGKGGQEFFIRILG
jgi:hypothetical protein